MARRLNRGEIWMYTFGKPDKRRPVLLISRQVLFELLDSVIVVPITRTIRGAPSEVLLGVEDGLKGVSCANVANVESVAQHKLTKFVGVARDEKLIDLCRALAYVSGCD